MAYANKKPTKAGYGNMCAGKMTSPAKVAAKPAMVKKENKVSGNPHKSAPIKMSKSTKMPMTNPTRAEQIHMNALKKIKSKK